MRRESTILRIRKWQYVRFGLLALFLAGFVVADIFFVGKMIYADQKSQEQFQQMYGKDWKERYEQKFGPDAVEKAHNKMIVGFASLPVIMTLLWLFFRQVTKDRSGGGGHRHYRKRQKYKW